MTCCISQNGAPHRKLHRKPQHINNYTLSFAKLLDYVDMHHVGHYGRSVITYRNDKVLEH